MQIRRDHPDLYQFWGDDLYRELYQGAEPVINLASKEYEKVIARYLTPDDIFITLEFKEFDKKRQKYVQKATPAKQARGQFVRYLAQNQVETLAIFLNQIFIFIYFSIFYAMF